MSEFRFEEPPAVPSNSRTDRAKHHRDAAGAMRERRDEWAVVKTAPTAQAARSAAHQIRSGRIAAYVPAGSFDAIARTVEGEHRVYARFIGSVEGGAR